MARTIAKDYEEKRFSILLLAAEVFARDGITRASMNDVASHCGISKATIYHYYESKDELVFGILDSYLSELRDRILQINLDDTPPEQQLNIVVVEFLMAYEGMDNQHKIQNEGLPMLHEAQQKILKGYQKEMINVVQKILQSGFPTKFSKNKTQLKYSTMSVFGMLNWFFMWNSNATRAERISYAETVSTLTFHGVGGLNDNNVR